MGIFDNVSSIVINNKEVQSIISSDGGVIYQKQNSKIETIITATPLTVDVIDNIITISLKDIDNNPLPNKTLTIVLENNTYVRTTDINGELLLSMPTTYGTYYVDILFEGDSIYEQYSYNANVKVNRRSTNLVVPTGTPSIPMSNVVITYTLKDNVDGTPIPNVPITVSFNGRTYSLTTDVNGEATLTTSTSARKTYTLVVSFGGNDIYASTMATHKIKTVSG